MNHQPYETPPRHWSPKLTPRVVHWSRRLRKRTLRRSQRLTSIESVGIDKLTRAVRDGYGVMVTPNHSAHYDWAALYAAADEVRQPLYFMTAWQVFAMSNPLHRWLMRRIGCFSIDRESADRTSFRQAVRILREETHPLVIFPEGDVYHVNDRVTPFREGAAAIALKAAKLATRPIVVVPCGIKFWYIDDPTDELERLMVKLEKRFYILEELSAAGVTLNITLVFSPEQYRAARDAVWRGAQRRATLDHFKSVYSIFVSRVDVYTEQHLSRLSSSAQGLVGIVNAKRLWAENQSFWSAQSTPLDQEIIFASTGTKKPEDSPTKYVEAFAGSDIETNPPATNDAVQQSGATFTRQVDRLPDQEVLDEIDRQLDSEQMEDFLMTEGIKKFADPQKALMALMAEKRSQLSSA